MKKVSAPALENKIDGLNSSITDIQCGYISCIVFFIISILLQFLTVKTSILLIVIDCIFLLGIILSKISTLKANKKIKELQNEYDALERKFNMIESLYKLHNLTKNRIKVLGDLYIYLADNFENQCNEKEYSYFYLDDYFFKKVKSYLILIEMIQKDWPKDEDIEDDLVNKIAEIEAEIEILANKYYDSIINFNRKECEMAIDMVHKTVNAPEIEIKALVSEKKKPALLPSKEEEKYKESIHEAMTNDTLLMTRQCVNTNKNIYYGWLCK